MNATDRLRNGKRWLEERGFHVTLHEINDDHDAYHISPVVGENCHSDSRLHVRELLALPPSGLVRIDDTDNQIRQLLR